MQQLRCPSSKPVDNALTYLARLSQMLHGRPYSENVAVFLM